MDYEKKFLNEYANYNTATSAVRLAAVDYIVHETKAQPDQRFYFYGPEDENDTDETIEVYIIAKDAISELGVLEREIFSIYFDEENSLVFESDSYRNYSVGEIMTVDLITIAHAMIYQNELLKRKK